MQLDKKGILNKTLSVNRTFKGRLQKTLEKPFAAASDLLAVHEELETLRHAGLRAVPLRQRRHDLRRRATTQGVASRWVETLSTSGGKIATCRCKIHSFVAVRSRHNEVSALPRTP